MELRMNIMTVVKYKVKDGFEEDFVNAINAYDYSKSLSMRLVSLPDNEYLSIMEYDQIDLRLSSNRPIGGRQAGDPLEPVLIDKKWVAQHRQTFYMGYQNSQHGGD